jgi:hypothetical protein
MNLNKEKIKENWPEINRRLKAKYRNLEDQELLNPESKDELRKRIGMHILLNYWDAELLNRIEAKVGKSKDELIKEINEMIS